MKVQIEQLTRQIYPIYVVSGDDYLLVQEASDTIRKYAKEKGYSEREVFYLETGFDWESFLNSINNTSLFGERTLIELHIKNKMTEAGNKLLQNYAKKPPLDKILVIITNKLDAATQKTAWFKAIDSCGAVLQVWPIDISQLPVWLEKRLKSFGLITDYKGRQLLANHVAGNLLAAVQEIEKLSLLYGNGNITVDQISAAITDNSRFNIFNLLDAAINNQPESIIKILERLRDENTEPTLILWALVNELRSLIKISSDIKQGLNIEQALTKNFVWQFRKAMFKKVLTKYKLNQLENILKSALKIELIIKGADTQHLLWHELSNFYLKFADGKGAFAILAGV
jgi:DNA polymerase III subunit delta